MMTCERCAGDTKVTYSKKERREPVPGSAIDLVRRRRKCLRCGKPFFTRERREDDAEELTKALEVALKGKERAGTAVEATCKTCDRGGPGCRNPVTAGSRSVNTTSGWNGRQPWTSTLSTGACRPSSRQESGRRPTRRRRTSSARCSERGTWTTRDRLPGS